jgi:uncharacterized membrane protein
MAKTSRIFSHATTTHWSVVRAFPDACLSRIEAAVGHAERGCSGQIRIAIEASLPLVAVGAGYAARERAIDVFSQLRVWDTEHNNGVLIYLLMAEQNVEIIADRGIDRKVGAARWEMICKAMEARFSRAEFEAGVIDGAQAIGDLLREFFPADMNRNEQSDRPVILR